MKFPKTEIRVEVSFLTQAQGGRRTAANLSDGQYRTLVIAGSRNELSEDEAMGRGQYKLFGIGFTDGPEAALPGSTVTASVFPLLYPEGMAELVAVGVFSVCEGRRIVGNGRVLDPPKAAVFPAAAVNQQH